MCVCNVCPTPVVAESALKVWKRQCELPRGDCQQSNGHLHAMLSRPSCHAATTWKRGMGLQRAGKDGSIALACHLLPGAADLLK